MTHAKIHNTTKNAEENGQQIRLSVICGVSIQLDFTTCSYGQE